MFTTTSITYTIDGVFHVQRVNTRKQGPLVETVKTGIQQYRESHDLKQALTSVADAYKVPPVHVAEDEEKRDSWFHECITVMCLLRGYAETKCYATVIRIPDIKPSSMRIDHTLPAGPENLRPMEPEEWEQKLMADIRNRPEFYYHELHPRQDDTGAFILLDGHDAGAWVREGDWLETKPVRKWATLDELKQFGYTTKELRKMVDMPGAPFVRIGKQYRTDVHEFTRWADSL